MQCFLLKKNFEIRYFFQRFVYDFLPKTAGRHQMCDDPRQRRPVSAFSGGIRTRAPLPADWMNFGDNKAWRSHAFTSNRDDTIHITPTFMIGLKTSSFGGWYALMEKRAPVRRFTALSMHADAVLESNILSGERSTPRFWQWYIFIFHLPFWTLLRNKIAPKSDIMNRTK